MKPLKHQDQALQVSSEVRNLTAMFLPFAFWKCIKFCCSWGSVLTVVRKPKPDPLSPQTAAYEGLEPPRGPWMKGLGGTDRNNRESGSNLPAVHKCWGSNRLCARSCTDTHQRNLLLCVALGKHKAALGLKNSLEPWLCLCVHERIAAVCCVMPSSRFLTCWGSGSEVWGGQSYD